MTAAMTIVASMAIITAVTVVASMAVITPVSVSRIVTAIVGIRRIGVGIPVATIIAPVVGVTDRDAPAIKAAMKTSAVAAVEAASAAMPAAPAAMGVGLAG